MVNKKGYIRTLEAIIAIVIILVFVLSILPQKEKESQTPKDIDLTANQILSEIQNNNKLRSDVISATTICLNYCNLKNFIKSNLPITVGFELLVCDSNNCYKCEDSNEECNAGGNIIPISTSEAITEKASVYAKSIIIKESGEDRTVKLFLWRKA